MSAFGSLAWLKPVPKPSPARLLSASRRTKERCLAAVESGIPVVSISSPPESHGVGASRSEMWAQRTGAAGAPRPPADALIPGLGEHAAEHVVDLFELLGIGDQRRRQLHDRVAAIVCTADQPALVELAGEEAAHQPAP